MEIIIEIIKESRWDADVYCNVFLHSYTYIYTYLYIYIFIYTVVYVFIHSFYTPYFGSSQNNTVLGESRILYFDNSDNFFLQVFTDLYRVI